jgi:hypothetical protein
VAVDSPYTRLGSCGGNAVSSKASTSELAELVRGDLCSGHAAAIV